VRDRGNRNVNNRSFVAVVLLLAGCTTSKPPSTPYTPGWPGSGYHQPPVFVPMPPARAGGDDGDQRPHGGNYAPPPVIVPVPSGDEPQQARPTPSGLIPQANAAEPAHSDPPPLPDLEKSPPATWPSPDDACVGAWRICHFF
jgi:hypothetical protein